MYNNPNPQQPPYQPGQQYPQQRYPYMPPTLPPHRPPRKKLHFWRYVALVIGALIVLSFCHAAATGTLSSDVATPMPDTALASSSTPMPTTVISQAATPAPTQAPTLTPRPTPTPAPKPTQAPQPTQPPAKPAQPAPTQPPAHQTVYNFDSSNGGKMVYNPPSDWCVSHSCVSTFWTATSGYVVQCANGLYSHSGGVRGVCSRDGGPAHTLYAH